MVYFRWTVLKGTSTCQIFQIYYFVWSFNIITERFGGFLAPSRECIKIFVWSDFDRALSSICRNKCQLDATDVFFIADLIACSTCFRHHYAHHQELESIIQLVAACVVWCFGFQVVGNGVELQQPANRTHNPQLHTIPTTWKPKHQMPQAATNCIILSSSWWWA
jgi:hypothetical protein